MAEESSSVILHGLWASPFVKRVQLALKIKGVPFDYVEELFNNKSPELLKYNPVYKKVPVLVHNGKPISESSLILEYIDEFWNNGPSLLPEDPFQRSQIRFWADFIQKQLFEILITVLKTEGEAQEKGMKDLKENLRVFEDGVKVFFQDGRQFFNGDELGFLDLVMVSAFEGYNIQEEVLGIKIIEEEKIPGIFSWLTNLIEHPLVKEISPPKEKLVKLLHFLRQNALQSAAA